jgi:hypothetical protein
MDDRRDPYEYFEQFETQTLASELATMIIGFDALDEDDAALLAALKRELRVQRRELAQAAKWQIRLDEASKYEASMKSAKAGK